MNEWETKFYDNCVKNGVYTKKQLKALLRLEDKTDITDISISKELGKRIRSYKDLMENTSLTSWDQKFLRSTILASRLTQKQQAIMNKIRAKLSGTDLDTLLYFTT